MSKIILLDTGPLGIVSNPKASSETQECHQWLKSLIANKVKVIIPEIADYELRRELLRADKQKGLSRLNILKQTIGYLPLTTETMLKAAELWAYARKTGQPTASLDALDGDVILAAQALAIGAIVATQNIGHLSRFVEAKHWRDIAV